MTVRGLRRARQCAPQHADRHRGVGCEFACLTTGREARRVVRALAGQQRSAARVRQRRGAVRRFERAAGGRLGDVLAPQGLARLALTAEFLAVTRPEECVRSWVLSTCTVRSEEL